MNQQKQIMNSTTIFQYCIVLFTGATQSIVGNIKSNNISMHTYSIASNRN